MGRNPMDTYVDNFRANLPSGVTYDADIARYFVNNKRFLNEWEVERYVKYIQKFASAPFYTVAGNRPELILDFRTETYVEYPYSINDNDPELVLDFQTETYEAA